MMHAKITAEHLARSAIVYVRQSTMSQVLGNLESQKRQYQMAESARDTGFAVVQVIDEDLGRSGSGQMARPGFQRLVAEVCSGSVGAVYCIEASRLARNGRYWHHLIDLCALTGALVVDPEGVYDPRQMNDRLLLGLKGTMSEYELNLLRQRGLAACDAKAGRGELRFTLPPGFCWSEDDRIEMEPDERVQQAIRLIFAKFRELGSGRQVFLWLRAADIHLPVVQRNGALRKITWRKPAYHSVMQVLHSPIYAGAYAFGRTGNRTRVVNGQAHKTSGHHKTIEEWSVLIKDIHEGYINWRAYEENRRMLGENAHMQKRAGRKSGRGGQALLSGMARCARCGRMMRVFYKVGTDQSHRYQCRGDDGHVGAGLCISAGGRGIDAAVANQLLEAASGQAIQAALLAEQQAARAQETVRLAVERELEEARYAADLTERRHEHVDPAKRHVARTLEARWNAALERVAAVEQKLARLDADTNTKPRVDPTILMQLASDLPFVWNAAGTDARARQRLVRLLIEEVVINIDEKTNVFVLLLHWIGGRHTEVRLARRKTGRFPPSRQLAAEEVLRKLGGHWPDRELAVTLNRMRCRTEDGETWTTVRVAALRHRLAIPPYDPDAEIPKTISVDAVAKRLGVCIASVHKLIRSGALPATQIMYSAPWKIPVDALESEAVRIRLQQVAARRPRQALDKMADKSMSLPGF